MFNHSKNFFSEKRANAYKEMLKNNGIKKVQITSGNDAFGQIQYRVEWN